MKTRHEVVMRVRLEVSGESVGSAIAVATRRAREMGRVDICAVTVRVLGPADAEQDEGREGEA